MSVIIKGMEMPQRCMDCGVDTGLCGLWNGYAERYSRRHPKCPLVEIPTPHGRLVDIKSVEDRKFTTVDNEYERWWNGAIDSIINNAPTVIEAEGSETE